MVMLPMRSVKQVVQLIEQIRGQAVVTAENIEQENRSKHVRKMLISIPCIQKHTSGEKK